MLELPPAEWSAYRARLRDEHHAGWLTAAHYLVLVAIADFNVSGDWEPTVRKIALNAGCDASTVRRARKRAQGRGLLMVKPQFEAGRQQANRYELVLPSTPVTPKPKVSRGRQTDCPSKPSILHKQAIQRSTVDNLALATRARAIQAQLQANYAMRRLL